ncbi:cytochrome P450 [Terasakiella pusilla]|uniref:cytochrome P450 n=1 Tax=Terasakiella pusilla TaxID=64973 RepID=UPI00048B4880|nr:cytochrome P450 [Terasakiella pusilla]
MTRFNLYSAEFDANPFDTYKELRDNHPCFWSEDAEKWVLTRYDDVVNALSDWQTYSSAKGNLVDEFPGRAGNTLGTMDPPKHDEVRSIVQSVFMKRNLKHLVGPIQQIARDAIKNNIGDRKVFDFAEDFAGEVTYKVLVALLGLPESEDSTEVKRNALLMVQTDPETRQKGPEHLKAFNWMQDFSTEVIELRAENPGEDLVSQLITAEVDGRKLDLIQVQTTVTTLIMAGIESLAGMLKVFGYNMAKYPDQRQKVLDDISLLPGAIEESMRFNSSAQRFRRCLTKDVTLHGQTMKAGDFVILAYGAANRDERKFPNPDVYDVTRPSKGHVGMGGGTHTCLGNSVARLAMKTAMEVFFEEIPHFSLAEPDDRLQWVASSNFRSPVKLLLVRD